MKIHFFTLAFMARPFIERHIEVFESLGIPWTWSVYYGGAHTNTGRPCPQVPDDGTLAYLLSLGRKIHFFDGAPDYATYLTERCDNMCRIAADGDLVWQVDADEMWTREQIETMYAMFRDNPERTAAWFHCRYFVGPDRAMEIRLGAGNMPYEWKRVWRWRKGYTYWRHDPPCVGMKPCDASFQKPFLHDETRSAGLVFRHNAFVLPEQVAFKAARYGWAGAVERWHELQRAKLPCKIQDYLPWLGEGTVEKVEEER